MTEQRPRSGLADVVLTYGGKLTVLAAGLATTVLLARGLGPGPRGVMAAANALALLLAQLGTVGLSAANPYFLAREPRTLPGVIGNSVWLALGLGSLLFVAGVVIRALLPGALPGIGWGPVLVALAGVYPALVCVFLHSVLVGQKRMVAYNAIEVTQAVGALATLALAFAVARPGVVPLLLILNAWSVWSALAAVVLLRGEGAWRRPDAALARRMLRYGGRIYVATLLAYVIIRLDLLLVNGFKGTAQAGQYSVAVALADGMIVLPTVVGLILLPRVAAGAGDEVTAAVFRITGLLYGLLCLITIPLAGPAVRLAFGEPFAGSVNLYLWLLPGIYSLGMTTVLANHFAGRGFPLQAMVVWFAGLAVNLALNLALLPRYGTVVASVSSSVAYTLLLVLHVRLFSRDVGLRQLVPRPSELRSLLPRAAAGTPAEV
jgi:O-antigen/teichoic acid export membrane protein